MRYEKLKIAIVGAGSGFFMGACGDIMKSDISSEFPLELVLMDIDGNALIESMKYAEKCIDYFARNVNVWSTTDLRKAVDGADFVITAIEVNRMYYWSMDYKIPLKYGFRQVYGENGGVGGMFHYLRNVGPMMNIARTMEELCPNALLINYSNPEAKLVETILKLTKIKAVGLCHGFNNHAPGQVASILERDPSELNVIGYGLNHFGFVNRIEDKATGEDLYPLFKEKEKEVHWLAEWDEFAISRIMYRAFGLWPYPGGTHIGEYFAWSDEFLASPKLNFFFDPQNENPWAGGKVPLLIRSIDRNPTHRPFRPAAEDQNSKATGPRVFEFNEEKIGSTEEGIPIIEAIVFDKPHYVNTVNIINDGNYVPGMLANMSVEIPAMVDGNGIKAISQPALPTGITAMINNQGYIQQLLIEAYLEKSRNKLLQAMLIDPTVSTYTNAVALINEICDLQKGIIAQMEW